jgi:hypothetical protein
MIASGGGGTGNSFITNGSSPRMTLGGVSNNSTVIGS